MIETREEYDSALAPLKWGAPDSAKALAETFEALREVARWAYHPDNCHTQMTGNRPCNCGYQKLRDALPDWITEE